jgi:hypothetical protein
VADGIPPEVLALAVFPGGSETIPDVGPGVHKFQCLIHPWMRSIAVVGDDEGKGGED